MTWDTTSGETMVKMTSAAEHDAYENKLNAYITRGDHPSISPQFNKGLPQASSYKDRLLTCPYWVRHSFADGTVDGFLVRDFG